MYRYIKRLFDIILSLFGLIILIPICILVKISFLCKGDKKSIFFKHTRIGKEGKPFMMYKFRSMVHNAEELLEELLKDERYRKEWAENQKIEKDPRITTIGAFLRKTSLDELPQLLNVLKGDMSFVGPRPERQYYIDKIMEHNPRYVELYQVRPGLTSYATLHNGYTDTMEKMLRRLDMDLDYLEHQSLWTDMGIMVQTVKRMIKGE